MSEILLVVAESRIMGEIQRDKHGHLAFIYDDRWRSMENAYPLSLSMPLDASRYEHVRIESWLQGLTPIPLPRRRLRGRIVRACVPVMRAVRGNRKSSSITLSLDAFDILAEAGWDLPGAVQIIRPERFDGILGASQDNPHVAWLTESDIAGHLKALAENPAVWQAGRSPGPATLSGCRPKMALFLNGNLWGVPYGPTPSTHIIKPASAESVVNEHLCLKVAGALGLPAVRSTVRTYEDEVALVVERYDRAQLPSGSVRRLHQEDLCQVMGLPWRLQKRRGGGKFGCRSISATIWRHSDKPQEDIRTFARTILLAWLLGSCDTHARNFAMLIHPGPRGRLAPLYDFSLIAAPDSERHKMKIKIGGKDRIRDIRARHWIRFADEISLPPDEVLHMGQTMAKTLPEVFSEIVSRASAEGVDHPIMARMVDLLDMRSRNCVGILETAA